MKLKNMAESSSSKTVEVKNPEGMHARPADLFAKCAAKYQSQIQVRKPEGEPIDGKSILSLLTLGAVQGTALTIEAVGKDADEAVDALCHLVNSSFQVEAAS